MIMPANERRSLASRLQRRTSQGGAAMVEYSLLLFAVLICAGAAIRAVGPSVACAGENATDSLLGGMSGGGCGGATASAGGAGGSAGGAGGSSSGASGSSSSAASGGSGGATAGASSGGGSGGGSDEGASGGAGSGGGGVASSSGYDDGAGGLIGSSGSSSSSGSGGAAGSGSGFASNATVGGGGGGGGGGSSGGGSGGSAANAGSEAMGEDSYAARGNNFASKTAGTTPQNSDITLAKLSSDVEGTHQKGADGFKPLTKAQLANAHITQSMLNGNVSGFKAEIYTNGKGDYVVAYRGTVVNSAVSWATDVEQGLGIPTKQYNDAARLAAAAKEAYGNNVVFTGHSLGGGLAASSAAETGGVAVTFNSSGVSDAQLNRDGVTPAAERAQAANGQMRNYETKGEMLSNLQNAPGSVMPSALGRPIQSADPDPAATKAADSHGLIAADVRAAQLHGDFLQSMESGKPVKYRDASGNVVSQKLTDPPHS